MWGPRELTSSFACQSDAPVARLVAVAQRERRASGVLTFGEAPHLTVSANCGIERNDKRIAP
jgi:antitoxin (DNA-binding transcriptional repressor) of toxin-antitoxin stability system